MSRDFHELAVVPADQPNKSVNANIAKYMASLRRCPYQANTTPPTAARSTRYSENASLNRMKTSGGMRLIGGEWYCKHSATTSVVMDAAQSASVNLRNTAANEPAALGRAHLHPMTRYP